ncbi:MAG: DUF6115 domain-containing protein [Lachnospiraceae bacterium]|nr:DUF6115 domain-containing protein [Lachnospiraceae bacterium]
MGTMEICLILTGIVIFAASFFVKEKKSDKINIEESQQDMRNMAQDIIKEEIQNRLDQISDDVLENTEAKLDKLANQKIMAVGNYSEDVLKNIENNHNEVMFLYNMLNDKEATLKNTVRDIEAVKVSVKKMSEETKTDKKPDVAEEKVKTVEKKEIEPGVQEKPQIRKNRKSKSVIEPTSGAEKKDQILELYQQGKTNVEIAQTLNLGVGEVNLVLGLFK